MKGYRFFCKDYRCPDNVLRDVYVYSLKIPPNNRWELVKLSELVCRSFVENRNTHTVVTTMEGQFVEINTFVC
jgi:hypothetical protein